MTPHSFCHLLHSAVDGWIFDLEPVVSIPANQKPHILFPIQLLLIDLQLGCVKQVGLGSDLSQNWKMNRNTMFPLWHWQKLIMLSWTADYRPHKTLSWLPFRKTGLQWCEHLAAVGAERELKIRTKQWMQQFTKVSELASEGGVRVLYVTLQSFWFGQAVRSVLLSPLSGVLYSRLPWFL